MSFPTPDELMPLREEARTAEGYLKRIERVIRERPELPYYKFELPLDPEIHNEITQRLAVAGWLISRQPIMPGLSTCLTISVFWPPESE